MLMLKALRRPSIALLWTGQALSSIGDEIYRVALIWLAVGLMGTNAGYLDAGRFAAILVCSVFGGKWADQWDPFKTLIRVDLLRALIVMIPVIIFHFRPVSLSALWIMALSVSGFSAFFDPVLLAVLPRISKDSDSLKAATGLMSTTLRLARILGPAIVGLLSPLISTVHFFTLDAISFGISAVSIALLHSRSRKEGLKPTKRVQAGFRESVLAGVQALPRVRNMSYVMAVKGVGGGIWSLGYLLGLALLVHQVAPNDVKAYGLACAAYGFGNFSGAVSLGNLKRERSEFLLYWGYLVMGLGFAMIGLAHGFLSLSIGCLISGFGGVLNDLPFVDMVQERFPLEDMPRIFRLRIAAETSATMIILAISPTLFRFFPIGPVICACGMIFLVFGIVGFSYFMNAREALTPCS